MKILLLAAEVFPFAKVGGLADGAGTLPMALRQAGHDARVFMPRYGCVDADRWGLVEKLPPFRMALGDETFAVSCLEGSMHGALIYFVDIDGLFGDRMAVYGEADDGRRFPCFCMAVFACAERLDWIPEVVHANDWHTALAPALLKSGPLEPCFDATASIFTIHNLAYQGVVERACLGDVATLLPSSVQDDWVNLMALGLRSADLLTTVSPTYAREILTPEFGAGLDGILRARQDQLFGVLNGIDTDLFNPATDPRIAANYSLDNLSGKAVCKETLQHQAGFALDPERPLLAMVSRLVDQKGFDLFAATAESLLTETPLQVVVLGTGAPQYHALLQRLEAAYPGRIRAWLTFDALAAEIIYAGADLFLMPSRFEPCGLGQLIAMRYGTVPVVRGTGGLVDTVEEGPSSDPRTGFVFWVYAVEHLRDAIRRALVAYGRPEEWSQLVRNDMSVDSSWRSSAEAYVELYRLAAKNRRARLMSR